MRACANPGFRRSRSEAGGARDPQSVAWREVARTIRDDENLLSAVLPIGTGLLVAIKRAQ